MKINLVCGLLVLLLSACTPLSPSMHLRVQAASQLNPDGENQALPVRIKIYQLRDSESFQEATFRELWKSDDSVLGKSLLDKKELTINPGQTQRFKMPRHSQTDYIAVVGLFRQYQNKGWKTIKRAPLIVKNVMTPMVIRIKGRVVEIE